MSDELRITKENARQAISICMANFIQQYSQKCNIKLQGWIEKSKVNLKQGGLCCYTTKSQSRCKPLGYSRNPQNPRK